jgi:hypothetical protein
VEGSVRTIRRNLPTAEEFLTADFYSATKIIAVPEDYRCEFEEAVDLVSALRDFAGEEIG